MYYYIFLFDKFMKLIKNLNLAAITAPFTQTSFDTIFNFHLLI